MKKKSRFGQSKPGSEEFVWITFSDLLTTLFMVFMVISLWAISQKEVWAGEATKAQEEGRLCLDSKTKQNLAQKEQRAAIKQANDEVVLAFSILQKEGLCADVNVETNTDGDGFHLFQTKGQEKSSDWFKDGDDSLSANAQLCLNRLGKIWISEINKTPIVSNALENLLVEGHANSKKFTGFNEAGSYLENLGLSQKRALAAARYLIGGIEERIQIKNELVELKSLLVAQGKSSLELIIENGVENSEKSKRLEFKVIVKGL